jgi:hypothetical protein
MDSSNLDNRNGVITVSSWCFLCVITFGSYVHEINMGILSLLATELFVMLLSFSPSFSSKFVTKIL